MGLFSFSKKESKLNWNKITAEEELRHFLNENEKPILFFKHSTRCSISSMALSRLEGDWEQKESSCELVFIDLIAFRSVSNLLSETTGIQHQSPQVIIWKNGKVLHYASHSEIKYKTIKEFI